MRTHADVVVVGGGIGGSSVSAALARQGIDVLVLERTAEHHDRVRGEYLTPWGVAETQKLGLYDDLLAAGGHHTKQTIPFSEGVPPDAARKRALDLTTSCEKVPGAICMQHVVMCNALNASSRKAGAEIVKPVERIQVLPGAEPKVRFVHDAKLHEVTCRLVIGADGRGSAVAKQAGITLHKDPPHHLMSGLLVEGVEEWPEDTQAIGVEGDVVFYIFPQGGGRARLYLAYSREQSARFSGPDSAPRFLEAFHLSSVPGSDILARSRPAGPCHGYPNEDTWSDDPTAPGVVLIGDAAGHNDPTIGQGLSITFRDARLVSDIILNNRHLSQSSFRPYAEERHERMRRLRFVGRLYSTLRAEFGDEARARRRRAAERVAADPSVMLPFVAMFKGPEALPREAFEQPAWDRFIG